MSTAGEAKPSRGPKGAARCELTEADAPAFAVAGRCKEAEMSTAGEAKPSRGPKGAARCGLTEADALTLPMQDGAMRPR